jgi:hypothetical protein
MSCSESAGCDNYTIKKLEMRGIPRSEFERTLEKMAEKVIDDTYYGVGWQVTLSAERQEDFRSFSMVVVEVTIAAEKHQFDSFLLTFRKKFLRGGG